MLLTSVAGYNIVHVEYMTTEIASTAHIVFSCILGCSNIKTWLQLLLIDYVSMQMHQNQMLAVDLETAYYRQECTKNHPIGFSTRKHVQVNWKTICRLNMCCYCCFLLTNHFSAPGRIIELSRK